MSDVDKPLHKDLSFWIVAVTLVGAATATQLYFGLPWFSQRLAQSRPAPRSVQSDQARANINQTASNLDLKKKTYSWQTPQFAPRVQEDTPPQVTLIPTEYAPPTSGWGQRRNDKAIGIRMAAEFVVQSAYNWPSRSRMMLADPVPAGQYDFIANLPTGALEALQAEIKSKWGVVATPETIQTNVLVLTVDHTNAPGLKPDSAASTPPTIPPSAPNSAIHFPRVPISVLVSYLENVLRMPVLDQTGLTGTYDLQIPNMAPGMTDQAGRIESMRTGLLEQLGLNLIATNTAVEVLVVKKASQTP